MYHHKLRLDAKPWLHLFRTSRHRQFTLRQSLIYSIGKERREPWKDRRLYSFSLIGSRLPQNGCDSVRWACADMPTTASPTITALSAAQTTYDTSVSVISRLRYSLSPRRTTPTTSTRINGFKIYLTRDGVLIRIDLSRYAPPSPYMPVALLSLIQLLPSVSFRMPSSLQTVQYLSSAQQSPMTPHKVSFPLPI